MQSSKYIAIIAAAISLFGALTAWINVKRATTLNTYSRVGDSLIKLNQIFVDAPQLRPYFIEGKKQIPKGQEDKARAIAVMVLNILENIWSQRQAMGKEECEAWKRYISHQIQSVELVNNAYKEREDWLPNLKQAVKKHNQLIKKADG